MSRKPWRNGPTRPIHCAPVYARCRRSTTAACGAPRSRLSPNWNTCWPRTGRAPWYRWIYDLRTNQNFTLKTRQLQRSDLDEFAAACYHPENRHQRTPTWSEADPTGRWRVFTFDELVARDKANLDIIWLRDESREDSANLPAPDVLAQEIADDLGAALEQIRGILNGMEEK